jgi:hypothetical protein
MARPTSYKPEYAAQAEKLCKLGATDIELADFFGVSEVTINAWKNTQPEFLKSLKAGKEEADQRVERSLYRRALAFEHEAVKIYCGKNGEVTQVPYREIVPPDTTACIFWLNNRRRDQWQDRVQVAGDENAPLIVRHIGSDGE